MSLLKHATVLLTIFWLILTNILLLQHPFFFRAYYGIFADLTAEKTTTGLRIHQHLLSEKSFDFLTHEENAHMDDVSGLFSHLKIVWLVLIVMCLGIFVYFQRKGFANSLSFQRFIDRVVKTYFFLCLVVLFFFVFFWEPTFVFFHKLFFVEGTWSFPLESQLITAFSPAFWNRVAILLVVLPLLELLILKYSLKRKRH